jgi:hypothetical protein
MNTNLQKPYEMIKDYITGNEIPNIGAEENRQTVEKISSGAEKLFTIRNYLKCGYQSANWSGPVSESN